MVRLLAALVALGAQAQPELAADQSENAPIIERGCDGKFGKEIVLVDRDAAPERSGDLVWTTSAVVVKGGDQTFAVKGTLQGHRYVFRARGMCRREPRQMMLWVPTGSHGVGFWNFMWRERRDAIFGIDFRVAFGAEEPQVLRVGENKPDQSEIAFVADRDDVPIRVLDHWDLAKDVTCAIDNLQVVAAPLTD
jgi:hypothetical protein